MKAVNNIKLIMVAAVLVWPMLGQARISDHSKPIDQAFSAGRYGNYVHAPKPSKVAVESQGLFGKWNSLKSRVKNKVNKWFAETPKKSVGKAKSPTQAKATVENKVQEVSEAEMLGQQVITLDKTNIKDGEGQVNKMKAQIDGANLISVSSPGRAGQDSLPTTKLGVPKFSLTKKVKNKKGKLLKIKIKNIPALDIGEEPQIETSTLTGENVAVLVPKNNRAKKLNSLKVFNSKQLKKWLKTKIAKAKKSKKLKNSDFGLGKVVSHRKIENVSLLMTPGNDTQVKPVTEVSRLDINMLGAVVLYNRKDRCHVVIGLFADLVKHSKHGNEAEFYLGACAHKMGFYSEAVNRLLRVAKRESAEFAGQAIHYLLKDVPKEYDEKIANRIRKLKNQDLIDIKDRDNANFLLAQVDFRNKKYNRALKFAENVGPKSKKYAKSIYIKGVSLYALNRLKQAELILESARKWMKDNRMNDKNLSSLISISLGRMRFNQNRYNDALADYISIKKDHPLWVEGLMEQGWTQLQLGDYSGAIGNMYSLHSPYFKHVFMPESHVIRTIGYLNICQFGDAYRTLTHLEKEHSKWYTAVDTYIKRTKKARQYYEMVKTYLKGNSQANVSGIPHQVIREISRQKDFLNYQISINEKEDEIAQYDFINGMVRKDKAKIRKRLRQATARATKLKKQIALSKVKKDLVVNVNQWKGFYRNEKKLIRSLKFELALYERGRRGYANLKKTTVKRFAKEKYNLGEKAARSLVGHMRRLRTNLNSILSNNEFLRYEIFAGSGENIRYQVAGGKSGGANRIPASVKPSKSLKWDFAGEYWADEIGSYRSSLKNNCPKLQGGGAPGYQNKTGKQSNNSINIQSNGRSL